MWNVKNLFSNHSVTLKSTTDNTILEPSFSKIAILKPSVPNNAFLKRDSETTVANPSF
jgi:hypothetical protein